MSVNRCLLQLRRSDTDLSQDLPPSSPSSSFPKCAKIESIQFFETQMPIRGGIVVSLCDT